MTRAGQYRDPVLLLGAVADVIGGAGTDLETGHEWGPEEGEKVYCTRRWLCAAARGC
jgi:hypothetical protein